MSNPRFTPGQSYTSWHVGMKVVCISTWASAGYGYGDERGPVAGEVYTIREIGRLHPDGGISVKLVEIVNPVRSYRDNPVWEPCFGARRFRPVQTRKTDISVFRAMLSPKPSKAGKVRA